MTRRFALLPLAASLFAVACSAAPSDESVATSSDAIVGGVVAQDGAWPGAAVLYKGTRPACGGALVADQWVLTAGHCVQPMLASGGITKVVVGRQNLTDTSGEALTVDRVYRHTGFGPRLDNDIALLHLSTPSAAPKSTLVNADQLSAMVPGADVTVVGWGRLGEGATSSSVLREVTVPIIDNQICARFPRYERVTNNMICAGLPQGMQDACQGDSGGPLFMNVEGKTVQVGIVSWGIGCARPNAPGVYTRLGNYLEWLHTTSGGEIATGVPTAPTTDPGPSTDAGPSTDPGPSTDAGAAEQN